jgi:hypothetical protein
LSRPIFNSDKHDDIEKQIVEVAAMMGHVSHKCRPVHNTSCVMLAIPEHFQQVVAIVRIDGSETQFSGPQVDELQLP